MSSQAIFYRGGQVFDGVQFHTGAVVRVEADRITAIGPDVAVDGGEIVELNGDILAPGYVDLQVNGGGGAQFNATPTVAALSCMAEAHRSLGATAILPTLITDSRDKSRAAIEATLQAVRAGVRGITGLHLEGPHLSIARKGAHDPALIRPMDDEDLGMLLAAAQALPALKMTLAPENATPEQVRQLTAAGVVVSLGHSDADFNTCMAYADAGASCVTHLFNAMSQLGNREPGLVGAALASEQLNAGLIADAIHVHPQTIRAAWAAKTGPARIFLVSDSMAPAGTDDTGFELVGRQIARRDGRLTLPDGTLAGADLDLTTALRVLTEQVQVPLDQALAAATSVPADVMGLAGLGRLHQTGPCSIIRISGDLSSVTVLH